MDKKIYDAYIDILNEELVPAMGCTEPIAVAYAGALARKTLGSTPSNIVLSVSRNIIKKAYLDLSCLFRHFVIEWIYKLIRWGKYDLYKLDVFHQRRC